MSSHQLWTILFQAGYLAIRQVTAGGTEMRRFNDDDEEAIDDDLPKPDSFGSDETNPSLREKINVSIPNREIRQTFMRWVNSHLTKQLKATRKLQESVMLFKNLVEGEFRTFADAFRILVFSMMPQNLLGGKEVVYQSWIHGFLVSAGSATTQSPAWEVKVESWAGDGRLDIIICRPGDSRAVIIELKGVIWGDRSSGYNDERDARIAHAARGALEQISQKNYRAAVTEDIQRLSEVGIAFEGPYCAIVGHLLERELGGLCLAKWEKNPHDFHLRARLLCLRTTFLQDMISRLHK